MSVKFLKFDTAAISDPKSIIDPWLTAKKDDCHPLAVTDCFDLEGGDQRPFSEALAVVNKHFDTIVLKLSKAYGEPTFSGTDKDAKFPAWAGTGYRVAFWKTGKRIIYLHITHIGTIAPVELNLGVVTGPPRNWLAGA